MVSTNDVFNEAVKESTLHINANGHVNKSLLGSKVLSLLLLAGIVYVGLNYYTKTMKSEPLPLKRQIVAEAHVEPNLIATVNIKGNNSEKEYLDALKSIESELTAERETVDLDVEKQKNLGAEMSSLIDDTTLADNTTYTQELQKEIGSEVEKVEMPTVVAESSIKEKTRKIIVKKGDTLQGLSTEFYGDPMNYKRIIASNDSLHIDETIYEGQTILLPY